MTADVDAIQEGKRLAGEAAAACVQSGMRVGLGTGSTTWFVIEALGRARKEGRLTDIVTVATSERSATQARALGLAVHDLSDVLALDVTIDGADEVDPSLNLVKGLGGALLREKIVASSSTRMVVVVDEQKLVSRLGTKAPLPIEIDPFGWKATAHKLDALPGCAPVLRMSSDGAPYRTDGGHYILDCRFDAGIADPQALEQAVKAIPGVIETGLFIGIATQILVGGPDGVQQMERGGTLIPLP